jgi:uncharacterized protein (DUF2062 family)
VPIIIVSYAVGAFVLGRPLHLPAEGLELLKNPQLFSGDYYRRIFVESWNIVWPFSVGATVLSVVCSVLAYPITLGALRAYQRRKEATDKQSISNL